HRVVAKEKSRVAVIEKQYEKNEKPEPPRLLVSNEDAVSSHALDGDSDLQVKCLLPDEPQFNFAVNTMVYQPGAALSMVEMHVMELMNLQIDQHGLLSQLETLATFSDAEPPAVTRIVFTPTDLKARAWVITLCEEAKLAVRQDAIGNIFARWTGADAAAPAVGTGSHIDAIPNAGKYDGVVGVLGGLEAIRALQRSGFRPKHSIELLVFATE